MVSSQASQSQLQNKTRLTTAILPMRDLHVPKRIQWHQLKFNAYYIARCVYLLVSKASADYYYYRNRQRKRWVYETVQMWVSTKTVSRCCESAVFNQANNNQAVLTSVNPAASATVRQNYIFKCTEHENRSRISRLVNTLWSTFKPVACYKFHV